MTMFSELAVVVGLILVVHYQPPISACPYSPTPKPNMVLWFTVHPQSSFSSLASDLIYLIWTFKFVHYSEQLSPKKILTKFLAEWYCKDGTSIKQNPFSYVLYYWILTVPDLWTSTDSCVTEIWHKSLTLLVFCELKKMPLFLILCR